MYLHLWGLKAICHDALEPIHAGGRGPRGPRGAPEGPRAERSFAKNKKCCNIFQKDFLKSTVTQSIITETKVAIRVFLNFSVRLFLHALGLV